jgi:hypothetical protein
LSHSHFVHLCCLLPFPQTGRDSQNRAASVLRAVQLSAKESGGLAAAAAAAAGDWRLLLSSAAAVVCLALYMKSRKE